MRNLKILLCILTLMSSHFVVNAINNQDFLARTSASISLKIPGNTAKVYPLTLQKAGTTDNLYYMESPETIPVVLTEQIREWGTKDSLQVNVYITALEDIYFSYSQSLATGFKHDDCLFYMPGFWYRKNLRSPKEAPSFHTSDSWIVREDRLSTPLTGIYAGGGSYVTVSRLDEMTTDALSTHREGEIILSGKTSLGFTGFVNNQGIATLTFGFPYKEAPRSYIRKLTLAPEVTAFQLLKKGIEPS